MFSKFIFHKKTFPQIIFNIKKGTKSYIRKFNQKVKGLSRKETVGNKIKLQNFLDKKVEEGKLYTGLEKTANYDQEFNEFLKNYQKKHQDCPNIVDLRQYTKGQNLMNKTKEMRKDELTMIKEFRTRQKLNQSDEGDEQNQPFPINENDADGKSKAESNLFLRGNFLLYVIDTDHVTLVTKLNRINHFRCLVFMGNFQGIIGYGIGKGLDVENSFEKAFENCKKNLIAVPLDHFLSLPCPIKASYYGFKMELIPQKSFNSWGNPMIAYMLMSTGITHCRFRLIYRNLNPYALIYTYFKLMTMNTTPKELSLAKGTKIYHERYGLPYWITKTPPLIPN